MKKDVQVRVEDDFAIQRTTLDVSGGRVVIDLLGPTVIGDMGTDKREGLTRNRIRAWLRNNPGNEALPGEWVQPVLPGS